MLCSLGRSCGSRGNRLLTLLTVQGRTEMPLTPAVGKNPWAVEERWVMSNMLPVPTGQIGNPIAMFVLVIADDRLLHGVWSLAVRS
jgi:hypothetical protein